MEHPELEAYPDSNSDVVSPAESNRVGRGSLVIVAMAMLALWVDLLRQLSFQWMASDQYAYGWFVPIIQAGLLHARWMNRPTPSRSVAGILPWVALLTVGLLSAPFRIVHEVNPDWPLISWALSISIVALTLIVVSAYGGKPWLHHFAFGVAFILVAVRWPNRIESSVTQGLMRGAALLTVEILGLLEIPAINQGNLIEIPSGVVGVDEACSGIRSLQSTLMGALFLGELYKLGFIKRAILVGGGIGLAFGFNCVRTTFLTWHAARSGIESVGKWHDPAGLVILVATLAGLWAMSLRMRRHDPLCEESKEHNPLPRIKTKSVVLVTMACCSGFVLNYVWYATRERSSDSMVQWKIAAPAGMDMVRRLELGEKERRALGANEDLGLSWTEPDGYQVFTWWFRWADQSMVSLMKARCHRPDVCLPASGMRLVEAHRLEWYDAGPIELPFRGYEFDGTSSRIAVFFCLWQDGTERFGREDNLSHAGRFDAVLRGTTRLGQQTLQVMISGAESYALAEERFKRILQTLVRFPNDEKYVK